MMCKTPVFMKSSLTPRWNTTKLFDNYTRSEMKFRLQNTERNWHFLSSLSEDREEIQALASLASHLKASNEKDEGHRLPRTWYSTSWKFPGIVSSSRKPRAAAKSITLSGCLILSFFKGKLNGCDIKMWWDGIVFVSPPDKVWVPNTWESLRRRLMGTTLKFLQISHCAAHYYPEPKHKHVICVIKQSSMLQRQPLPSSPPRSRINTSD